MSAVLAAMRDDWDSRAREDAHYYVAFGRRNQSGDEFFATAHEQVRGLTQELKRLPPAHARSRRAVEIGCGPGRLMRPMSAHFGEIHGVDISGEMAARARANLASVPHAHAHHAPNSNLEAFASDSFDFVYSYAVFQHIPSRDVVFEYLREAWRVLKPHGILRCQINGLPKTARQYDTWSGVRVSGAEVREFAREQGFALLALEGDETQYMWTTFRKGPCWSGPPAEPPAVRRLTNAQSSEPAAPVSGPFASIALWVQGLPPDACINTLTVEVNGLAAEVCYLGPLESGGIRQLNAYLPAGLRAGLASVTLRHAGQPFAAPGVLRLMPPGPAVPRLTSLTDGVDLLSGQRIVTGSLKATLEEVRDADQIRALVNGAPAVDLEHFRTDPRLPRHEVNFRLPEGVGAGPAVVGVYVGARLLAEVRVEVA